MSETNETSVETKVEETAPAEVKTEETKEDTNGESNADLTATIAGKAAKEEAKEETEVNKSAEGEVVYDFKGSIPEGFEFSEEESNKFVEVIKGMNLSNEQANAIAKYGMEYAQTVEKQIGEAILAERKAWGEQAKQELGTDFDKTVRTCGLAVEHIEKNVPGIRQALNETGAGNRIEIIKALSILGEMLSADPGMASKSGVVNSDNGGGELASRYPNTDFKKYL